MLELRRIWVITKHLLAKYIIQISPALMHFASTPNSRSMNRVSYSNRNIDIIRLDSNRIIRLSTNQAIYITDMENYFEYYFNSVNPVEILREDGKLWQMVDFSTPRLHKVNGFDDFPVVFPSLAEPFVTTLQYLDFAKLKPNQVAMDLGCYCALSSIAFSKAVGPGGRVVAVEPDPLNRIAAKANLDSHEKFNHLKNIEIVSAAVSGRRGTAKFSSEGAMGSSLTSIVGNYRGNTVEVECLTLQDIVDRLNLSRIDFIKIDIEGAELELLLSSGAFLNRYKPRLIIEPHPLNGQLTSEPIINFLSSINYTCIVIEQTGLTWPLITAIPA